jgi:glycerol-3-phosphate acyltransferase PlsY
VDIRREGSGNIGATNLSRALGRRWGIAAFLLDYAKGLLPVLAAQLLPLGLEPGTRGHLALGCGAAAVAGHLFPLYLGFRGGKGVATTFGVMTALAWVASLAAGFLWLALYLGTRIVSVASLAAALCLPAAVWLSHLGRPFAEYAGLEIFAGLLAAAIVLRHRSNIARLLRGEEHGFRKPSPGSQGGGAAVTSTSDGKQGNVAL